MNIAVDIKAFKNGKTGIARYVRSLLDWLQKIDTVNNYLLFECTPSDYVPRNPRWKKILLPWKLPGIIWQQLVLPLQLGKHAIDVLWAPEQICPLLYRGRIVTTVYDVTALRFPETCQRSNRLIQRYLFPLTMKRSACCMPISDFIGRELREYYPVLSDTTRIETVACGSPDWPVVHEPSVGTDKPFLFFAGNREPRKNLVRLIEALELLFREGMPIALHLAGPPGWKNNSVDERIANGPLRETVSFLGYLSEEKLKEQYRTCAAVVYPSVYEGFGLPVLEAFAMGTRVITSKGTVMEEIAGSAAVYFDPLDTRDLSRAIRETLVLPPPGTKDFTMFKGVLDTYSWESSARRQLAIMESVGNMPPKS